MDLSSGLVVWHDQGEGFRIGLVWRARSRDSAVVGRGEFMENDGKSWLEVSSVQLRTCSSAAV